MKRVLAGLAILLAVVYGIDFLQLRYKASKSTGAYESVIVDPYYAVQLKGGKTEFMFDKPQTETCVTSLFPHLGFQPCWYLRRNKKKRIDV